MPKTARIRLRRMRKARKGNLRNLQEKRETGIGKQKNPSRNRKTRTGS